MKFCDTYDIFDRAKGKGKYTCVSRNFRACAYVRCAPENHASRMTRLARFCSPTSK